jgi:hypothetical protein
MGQHENWCIDIEPATDDDGHPDGSARHGSGVDACVGRAFDVAGVTGWLQRIGRGPVRCIVDGRHLDRGNVLKLIAELEERLPALPA